MFNLVAHYYLQFAVLSWTHPFGSFGIAMPYTNTTLTCVHTDPVEEAEKQANDPVEKTIDELQVSVVGQALLCRGL